MMSMNSARARNSQVLCHTKSIPGPASDWRLDSEGPLTPAHRRSQLDMVADNGVAEMALVLAIPSRMRMVKMRRKQGSGLLIHSRLAMSALCISALLAGCGEGSSLDVPELRLEEALRIGELDDPQYSLHRVAGITTDPNGNVYIADSGDARVRVYSRRGVFVRDIGRPGHGPGEFLSIMGIGIFSDTIYVIDRQADRVSLFDTAGTLIRTARSTHGTFDSDAGVMAPFKLLGNGSEVSSPISRGLSSDERIRLLLTREGTIVDTLLSVPDSSSIVLSWGAGTYFLPHPFVRPAPFSISPGGEYYVTILAYPDTALAPGEFEIRVNRVMGGPPRWQRVFHAQPVAYSRSKADSIIEMHARVMPPEVVPAFRAAVRPPAYEPQVQSAVVSDDGEVYLRMASTEDSATWLVIDGGGKATGRIRLPRSARHVLARGDTLLVVEDGPLDIPVLVEYRIRRR
jgi:hypothetical protein